MPILPPSPIFLEVGAHLYRSAFLAAREVLHAARKWRNDIEQLGPGQYLGEAKCQLDAAVEGLAIALAPPVVDGTFIDPRDVPLDPPDNTQLHELLNAERANIAAELAAVRGATVSHFKFSGRSAHEVVHKLGRQTLTALMYLTGMRSQETLEHLVAPESHLRTETRGLGAISAEEADLVEAECLWEAEEAWRRKKTCTLTPREAVTPPEPEADGPGQKATARPAPEETDAEKTGANPAGEWWKNGPPEPDSKFRTNPIEASLKQLAHGIGYDERAVKEGNGTSGWWIQKIHRYKYRAWFDSAGMAEKVTRLIEAGRASKRAEERRSAPNDKKPKRRTS